MCIACRAEYDRSCLLRITRLAGVKSLVINPDKYQHGRSAYVCKSQECINTLMNGKKLLKILKVNHEAVERIVSQLQSQISNFKSPISNSLKGVLLKA